MYPVATACLKRFFLLAFRFIARILVFVIQSVWQFATADTAVPRGGGSGGGFGHPYLGPLECSIGETAAASDSGLPSFSSHLKSSISFIPAESGQWSAKSIDAYTPAAPQQVPREFMVMEKSPNSAKSVQTGRYSVTSRGPGEKLYEFRVKVGIANLSPGVSVANSPLTITVQKSSFPETPSINEIWLPNKMPFFSALSHACKSPRSGATAGLSFRRGHYDDDDDDVDNDDEEDARRVHSHHAAAAANDSTARSAVSLNHAALLDEETFLLEVSAHSHGCGKSTLIRALACSLSAHLLRVDVSSWMDLVRQLRDEGERELEVEDIAELFESIWLQTGVVMEEKLRNVEKSASSDNEDDTSRTPRPVISKYVVVLELPTLWTSFTEDIASVVSFVLDRGESGVPVVVIDKNYCAAPLAGGGDAAELHGEIHCGVCDKNGVKQLVAMSLGLDIWSWDFAAPDTGPLLRPAVVMRLLQTGVSRESLAAKLEELVQLEGLMAAESSLASTAPNSPDSCTVKRRRAAGAAGPLKIAAAEESEVPPIAFQDAT